MALHKEPFSCCALNWVILELAWKLVFPEYHVINRFAKLFKPTTLEQSETTRCRRFFDLLFWTPVLLFAFLLFVPLAVVAVIIWFPIQFCRRDYCYSESSSASERNLPLPSTLSVATANICLLPGFATRSNNLNGPNLRVDAIANRLLNLEDDANANTEQEPTRLTHFVGNGSKHDHSAELGNSVEMESLLPHRASPPLYSGSLIASPQELQHIETRFPKDIDLLCLCEVFDRTAAKTLVGTLHNHFDYIIYDVSERPALNLLKACNSGLLFASKFPIAEAEFCIYDCSEGSDSLAMKGVLLVKLWLGMKDGRRLTGYLTHTHLQAKISSRSGNVQEKQMDWIKEKMEAFEKENQGSREVETRCFDLLTGDLNFDATSSDEAKLSSHPLFKKFKDPCRSKDGKEVDWSVGTELIQSRLYDPEVSTPEGLKSILSSSDEVRSGFVASTNSQDAEHSDSNGKRRIDYICYEEDMDVDFALDHFRFVTALATLTDHVPMAMTFSLSEKTNQSGNEEEEEEKQGPLAP